MILHHEQGEVMTPPNPQSSQSHITTANVTGQDVFQPGSVDDLEYLSFEELRELPMRLALGFETFPEC